MRTTLLLSRIFRLDWLVATCCIALLLACLLPVEPLPVPGSVDLTAVVTRMIAVLPAVIVPVCFGQIGDNEVCAAKSLSQIWIFISTRITGIVALFSIAFAAVDAPEFGRNLVLLATLGIIADRFLGRFGWAPVVAFVMANWLWGMQLGGIPKSWAIVMHPISSVPALVITILALLIVIIWQVIHVLHVDGALPKHTTVSSFP